MKLKGFIIFLLVLIWGVTGSCQILINEVCSSNGNVFEDDFGDTPDWIEIYNSGDEVVNLGGFYITDNTDIPRKWKLPPVNILPNGYFLIMASERGVFTGFVHTNFKISKGGETIALFDSERNLLDKLIVLPLEENQSFGLREDGKPSTAFFSSPSPGTSNSDGIEIIQTLSPIFPELPQFQSQPFLLELNPGKPGNLIHYTLDGSLPTVNSPVYSEPILIEKTMSIRAFSKNTNEIASEVITNNYFLKESSILPIVAVSVDSVLLFDDLTGMLMSGPDADTEHPYFGANFWKDIEVPVNVEYFSEDGIKLTEFDAGAKVHGGTSSRTKPQKSMRFLAKPEYGIDKIEYPFFESKPQVNAFSKIVIRNSSGDFNNTHFRDGFLSQYLDSEDLNLDLSGYQPVHYFLNGKYWGVINLREKTDESFVVSNYGIELDKLDVLEEDTLVIYGDRTEFADDVAFVKSIDIIEDAALEEVGKRFDLENMVDYFIAETAINNNDWGHNNLKLWKEKSPEGRWRYIMFDLDNALAGRPWTSPEISVFQSKMTEYGEENPHFTVFYKLLTNDKFRNYFINRYCDLLNTTFEPEHFSEAFSTHAEKMSKPLERHFARWADCPECNSFEQWDTVFVPRAVDFCLTKAAFSRVELLEFFELKNEILLTLNVFPKEAGVIKINTISPEEIPWFGYYFNGAPVEISVEASPGFEFDHWESLNHDLSMKPERFSNNFLTDDEVVAVFKHENLLEPVAKIIPNPAHEELVVYFSVDEKSTVDFELISSEGKTLKEFSAGTILPGEREFFINVGDLVSGYYLLKITRNGESELISFLKN